MANIDSPDVATNMNENDGDYGFESREYLRKILIGKKVEYEILIEVGNIITLEK